MTTAAGAAHLALCEVLGFHNVVKQLSSLAQLHDYVDIVLVLAGALQNSMSHETGGV